MFRCHLRLIVAVLAVLASFGGVASVTFLDGRPTLNSEIDQMLAFSGATTATLSANSSVEPVLYASADRPPGSQSDQVSYDHCDSWRSWLWRGWQAGFGYRVSMAGERALQDTFAAVERVWSTYDGDLTTEFNDTHVDLRLRLDHSQYRLTYNRVTQRAELSGGTDCLPTD